MKKIYLSFMTMGLFILSNLINSTFYEESKTNIITNTSFGYTCNTCKGKTLADLNGSLKDYMLIDTEPYPTSNQYFSTYHKFTSIICKDCKADLAGNKTWRQKHTGSDSCWKCSFEKLSNQNNSVCTTCNGKAMNDVGKKIQSYMKCTYSQYPSTNSNYTNYHKITSITCIDCRADLSSGTTWKQAHTSTSNCTLCKYKASSSQSSSSASSCLTCNNKGMNDVNKKVQSYMEFEFEQWPTSSQYYNTYHKYKYIRCKDCKKDLSSGKTWMTNHTDTTNCTVCGYTSICKTCNNKGMNDVGNKIQSYMEFEFEQYPTTDQNYSTHHKYSYIRCKSCKKDLSSGQIWKQQHTLDANQTYCTACGYTVTSNTPNKTIYSDYSEIFLKNGGTIIYQGTVITLSPNDAIALFNTLNQEIGGNDKQVRLQLEIVLNGYLKSGYSSFEEFIASGAYGADAPYTSYSDSKYNLNGTGYLENVTDAFNNFITNPEPQLPKNTDIYAGYEDLKTSTYYLEAMASYKKNHPNDVIIIDENSPFYSSDKYSHNIYSTTALYPHICSTCKSAYVSEIGYCFSCSERNGSRVYCCPTCITGYNQYGALYNTLDSNNHCSICNTTYNIEDNNTYEKCPTCNKYLVEGICFYCSNRNGTIIRP